MRIFCSSRRPCRDRGLGNGDCARLGSSTRSQRTRPSRCHQSRERRGRHRVDFRQATPKSKATSSALRRWSRGNASPRRPFSPIGGRALCRRRTPSRRGTWTSSRSIRLAESSAVISPSFFRRDRSHRSHVCMPCSFSVFLNLKCFSGISSCTEKIPDYCFRCLLVCLFFADFEYTNAIPNPKPTPIKKIAALVFRSYSYFQSKCCTSHTMRSESINNALSPFILLYSCALSLTPKPLLSKIVYPTTVPAALRWAISRTTTKLSFVGKFISNTLDFKWQLKD